MSELAPLHGAVNNGGLVEIQRLHAPRVSATQQLAVSVHLQDRVVAFLLIAVLREKRVKEIDGIIKLICVRM